MYIQFDPPPDLKHLVSFFYAMEHQRTDGPLQPLLPSATEVNGWQYKGRWRLFLDDKRIQIDHLLPKFYIVGQQTVSYKLAAQGSMAGIFGAALQPGTAHFLTGLPAHRFTNNPIEMTTLFDKTMLSDYIKAYHQLADHEARLALLVRFYRQFTKAPVFEVYRQALQIIYQQRGSVLVQELCDQLRVNERYLQREFRQKVGVPPSTYLQIIRFNNVFTELSLSEEKQNIERLAMVFRYYDISHFNKTHKKYFGVPPSRLMLNRLVLLQELIRQGPYLLQVQSDAQY